MINGPHHDPWTSAQVRVVAASDLAAALLLAFAAHGAGHGSVQDQVMWLNVAVLSLVLAVVANGSLFLVARRAVGQRRLRVLPDVMERIAPPRPASASPGWWWLPGTARAHVAGCPMIAGKPAQEISAAHIRASRLTRCEICG